MVAVISRTASSYAAPGRPGFSSASFWRRIRVSNTARSEAPAQKAFWPEVLVVIGVDRFPAELMLQVIGGGLLDEGVFGVTAKGHSLNL